MKIEQIEAFHLSTPCPQPFQSSFSTFYNREACLVKISTDQGLVGWGEALGPPAINRAIVLSLKKLLIGKNPLNIEPLWLEIYSHLRDQGQRGICLTAQSAIDIALWDIAGKFWQAPIHALLGGAFRQKVSAYATGGFRLLGQNHAATVKQECIQYQAMGFKGVKIKIGYGVEEDLLAIQAARSVLNQNEKLMIDANHGYDTLEAVRLGRAAEAYDIDWFEEPVLPELLTSYQEVRQKQPIPVAGGETWHGRAHFQLVLDQRCVDILQPDVAGCGGITEIKKIIAAAETAGVRVVPHVWGTLVNLAASLQILAIIPPQPPRYADQTLWLEFDQTPHSFRQTIGRPNYQLDSHGQITISQAPGLGIEIDEAQLAPYLVAD